MKDLMNGSDKVRKRVDYSSNEPLKFKRELGLAAATAIVVGNMIGSGIFMAPQGLAAASNPKAAMIAWIITSIGSILLALSFAKLGTAMPKTGGPIVYTRAAFGEFAAFLIAWTYWIGIWVGDAAIITAATSYLTYFFPVFGTNRLWAFLMSSLILWIFTAINVTGVKQSGIIGIVTTVCKILPLLIFAGIAAMHFNYGNFNTVSSNGVAGLSTIPVAISITLWSFLGLESATIPAEEIKNPEKNIKLSTILGTTVTAVICMAISALAFGAVPQGQLAASNAPLADTINVLSGGTWGGPLIATGAVISTLGAISGWILLSGRCSFAAAEEKLFPPVFGKIHPKFKTPWTSILIASIGTNIVLITNYVNTLTGAFNFILLLSTLACLPIYTFAAAADIVLLYKKSSNFNVFNFIKNSFLALVAFAYSIYAIYGTGAEIVMYGFILMLLGIPFYSYMKIKDRKE